VTRPLRRAAAAAAATTLALGLVLVAATPASADTGNVFNATTWWDRVYDNALDIQSTGSVYSGLFGTGDRPLGWSAHGLNHFVFDLAVSDGVETQHVTTVPQQFDLVDGGLSTVRATASVAFASGAAADLTVTLELQGSYARWTFTGVTDDELEVRASGSIGASVSPRYTMPSPMTLVASDGPTEEQNTVTGFQLVGTDASLSAVDGDRAVAATFPAAGTTRLVVALGDHDPCGYADAVTAMVARVATLDTTFGEDIWAPDTRCLDIAQPAALVAGTATDQTLPVTDVSSSIAAPSESALDHRSSGDFLARARLYTSGLPAGLGLDYDPIAKSLHLQGAADEGSYAVRIALAYVRDPTDTVLRGATFSTITVTVGADTDGGSDGDAGEGKPDAGEGEPGSGGGSTGDDAGPDDAGPDDAPETDGTGGGAGESDGASPGGLVEDDLDSGSHAGQRTELEGTGSASVATTLGLGILLLLCGLLVLRGAAPRRIRPREHGH